MKKNMMKRIATLLTFLITLQVGISRENVPGTSPNNNGSGDGQRVGNSMKVLTGCAPGKAQTEIKLNNVRTRILTCGDMWWDLQNAKYEVPKGSNSYASFAGSLWFGGKVGPQLRVSAMTYRQGGVDFWPGPLDPTSVDIDATTCNSYDKHWRFIRTDVDEFYSKYASTKDPSNANYGSAPEAGYTIPSWIKDYPGDAPSPTASFFYLAPFVDVDNDFKYIPENGDYPAYNVLSAPVAQGQCKKRLFGDETLFWVFNDAGNIHSESESPAVIGVEIRAQAFEFATSDELNDMTFYNFEIINRSSNTLDSTYFAVWVDADLGAYDDDFIGCDVERGLGYIYNGDNYDEDQSGQTGYHGQLPALGCDFFQGPNADINDGVDNDRDGCTDCTYFVDPQTGDVDLTNQIPDEVLPEQIIMSRFSYYNNTADPKNGNPSGNGTGQQFYNLMIGKWKDGSPITWGGNGVGGSVPCKFVYPDESDPNFLSTNGVPATPFPWNEVTAGSTKGDRRFLQSAGQFQLLPGAVNYVTFGMPFVRTTSDNNFAAIPLLQAADDKAQALFDQCFKVLDGPDAPDMTIQELNNELIIFLSNKASSNNYEQKRYRELDVTIPQLFGGATDRFYRFEGYMVYQLKDESVSQTDLDNSDKARLIFQCDIKNGVKQVINYNTDPTLGIVPQLMTPVANNEGIYNSFKVSEDQFAEGDKKLVNHRTYHFMAVSYAFNQYLPYRQDVAPGTVIDSVQITATDTFVYSSTSHDPSGDYTGQKKPFLKGRKNIKVYSAVPHNPAPEANGTIANSTYGFGPKVTRIEGQGNGGYALDLTQETIDRIMNPAGDWFEDSLIYENTRGPINVKVIDPLRVLGGDFVVKLKKVYPFTVGPNKGLDSAYTEGLTSDLDSGKVKGAYKFQIEGTYVNGSGQTKTKTWNADEAIGVGQEQILLGVDGEPLGISVTIKSGADPNRAVINQIGSTQQGELLESSISFTDAGLNWLTGVRDFDGETPFNWILSGTTTNPAKAYYSDVLESNPNDPTEIYIGDPNEVWENVVNRTWAPYRFVAWSSPGSSGSNEAAPAPGFNANFAAVNYAFNKKKNVDLDNRNISSVDIVFTSDKSKWTRCAVIEMNHFPVGGKYQKFALKKRLSVDKNGNKASVADSTANLSSTNPNDANYISPFGMGWFPGYAINIETGERLNMVFGENSTDANNNGNDMIWNPTSNYVDENTGKYVFGGMHYIYVFGHNSDGVSAGKPIDVPRYDAGAALVKMLDVSMTSGNGGTNGYAKVVEAWRDAMWVNLPIVRSTFASSFPANQQPSIPTDVKVRIRVTKPMRYGWAANWAASYSTPAVNNNNSGTTTLNSTNPANLTSFISSNPRNNNFPMYKFNTWDLVAKTDDAATAQEALNLINVVPNPYYGHSKYERTRIDNVIKIINLPVKCKIRIYTINGTLIRTINKDTDATTDVVWDLKNEKNIPIASGLYIIHIDAQGIGEKIIKWFGVMRPLDLQSY